MSTIQRNALFNLISIMFKRTRRPYYFRQQWCDVILYCIRWQFKIQKEIIVAFPWYQWLCQSTAVLRGTYIACLVLPPTFLLLSSSGLKWAANRWYGYMRSCLFEARQTANKHADGQYEADIVELRKSHTQEQIHGDWDSAQLNKYNIWVTAAIFRENYTRYLDLHVFPRRQHAIGVKERCREKCADSRYGPQPVLTSLSRDSPSICNYNIHWWKECAANPVLAFTFYLFKTF